MSDPLKQLYQAAILDHNRSPRNAGPLPEATHSARGHNPLCGDDITVHLRLDPASGLLDPVRFEGDGCAIAKAAASMMAHRLQGLSPAQARLLADHVRAMLLADPAPDPPADLLGDLMAFASVRAMPTRVKCALLPWHALNAALDGRTDASTEGVADPLNPPS